VIEVQRDSVTLHDGHQTVPARLLPSLRHGLDAADDALAVGDWVIAEHHGLDPWWVAWRMPPVTRLSRRLHDGRDKVTRAVLVSNVDTVLVVMGLDGDFNLRRLERYLALVAAAGLGGVVVLTKADACADIPARLAAVRRLLPPGLDAIAVDARDASACEALRPWLGAGQTLVAMGSSGAGKSTLTNTLTERPGQQATGGTREGDGRGRHTTATRSLHLTPDGACLIDTPGVRTLRLDLDADDLAAAFDDIARLALQCRFRDCRHGDEPDCAVRAAVAPERLRNFHKLQREARRDTMSALDKQAEQAVWRQRSKASRARLADKGR
jgi:ribosome biogenesis GTPase / thiamine phosphate phosphatase